MLGLENWYFLYYRYGVRRNVVNQWRIQGVTNVHSYALISRRAISHISFSMAIKKSLSTYSLPHRKSSVSRCLLSRLANWAYVSKAAVMWAPSCRLDGVFCSWRYSVRHMGSNTDTAWVIQLMVKKSGNIYQNCMENP